MPMVDARLWGTLRSRGLTQQKLAIISGVRANHISEYMNQKRTLTDKQQEAIAKSLGLKVTDLFTYEDEEA